MTGELQDWFTGEDDGHAVFYSPHRGVDEFGDEWDPLWVRLTDAPEIGSGPRSFSLTNGDLRWLYELLAHHFNSGAAS